MTPQEKKVWELRHLKCGEIAKKLDMNPRVVAVYMQKAKKKQKQETETMHFLPNNMPTRTPTDQSSTYMHNTHKHNATQHIINSPEYRTECYQAKLAISIGIPHLQRFGSMQRKEITALAPSTPFAEDKLQEELTARELEIWHMRHKKRGEIAKELGISAKTVDQYMWIVKKKLSKDFIPKASVPELTAAMETAGLSNKNLWKHRGKKLKLLTKPRDHVVLKVTEESRKKPEIAKELRGLSPTRINLEGDAEYIISATKLNEMFAALVGAKLSS